MTFIMLLMISTAESTSRHLLTTNKACKVTCSHVVAVQPKDTCLKISGKYNKSLYLFLSLNPNLDCHELFEQQWVCVEGTYC
ncbi:hypothetical protein LINPERHAP1_LOCUS37340 [Linum perenne]